MKATRKIVEPQPPPPPEEIDLTLTVEQASLLMKFAGQVAGVPQAKSKKFYQLFCEIFTALHLEGIKSSASHFYVESGGLLNRVKIGDK